MQSIPAAIVEFNDALRQVTAQIGQSVRNLVALSNPAAVMQFDLALRDLGAVVGQALLPVLKNMTATVRYLADVFLNLPAPVKDLIAIITGVGVAFIALKAAIFVTSFVLTMLKAAALATTASFVGITVAALPFLALGAVVIGVISLFVDLGSVVKDLIDTFSPVSLSKSSVGAAVQQTTTNTIAGIGVEQAKLALQVGVSQDTQALLKPLDAMAVGIKGLLAIQEKQINGETEAMRIARRDSISLATGVASPVSASR